MTPMKIKIVEKIEDLQDTNFFQADAKRLCSKLFALEQHLIEAAKVMGSMPPCITKEFEFDAITLRRASVSIDSIHRRLWQVALNEHESLKARND